MKLALLLACLLPSIPVAQKIIHVPGDAPSIQIGIAIADDGDTVLVAPGLYQERIDFLGRAITLRSEQGPEATRIDATGIPTWPIGIADGWGRVVRCISGESLDTVLDGFTITASVQECPGWASAYYGGVLCDAITIRNCHIISNLGLEGAGVKGSPLMENCRIEGNYAAGSGGGVYGSPTMINCVIKSNRSGGPCAGEGVWGGGVYATSSACLLVDCRIEENMGGAGYEGGGVYGPATLVRCLVARNVIPNWAGTTNGGGVYGAALLDRCSIVENNIVTDLYGSPGKGGGISNCAQVVNCIIWGNNPDQTELSGITYSDVQGGAAGTGTIDDDPRFLNPGANDYRILPDSPCVDSGNPLSVLDADGTVADMGVFPFNQYPSCSSAKVPVAAKLAFDHVGSVAAAAGPYLISGAPDVDGAGFETGAAFLAYREGPAWIALPKLLASDAAPGALFGAAAALDDGVAWIGAPGVAGESGASYVFRQQEDGTWAEEIKLLASDGTAGSRFGTRVVVEGDLAAASAPLADSPSTDSGAVYLFEDQAAGWTEIDRLMPFDWATGDRFGSGLALSGQRLLIGAAGDNAGAGSAYIFEDQGSGWGQYAKLVAADASANEQFGHVVDLDGDVAVIGAPANRNQYSSGLSGNGSASLSLGTGVIV